MLAEPDVKVETPKPTGWSPTSGTPTPALVADLEWMREHFRRLVMHTMSRTLTMNDMHGNRVIREAVLDNMNKLSREMNLVFDLWLPTPDSANGSLPSAKS
jgi:hypothetical protein